MAKLRLRIVGVPCSACIVGVRRILERADGVKSVGANYVADYILIDYEPSIIDTSAILSLIKKVGYEAIPLSGLYL